MSYCKRCNGVGFIWVSSYVCCGTTYKRTKETKEACPECSPILPTKVVEEAKHKIQQLEREFADAVAKVIIEDLTSKGDIYQMVKSLMEKGARHD